jgi:hypothetical protein
MVEDLDEDSSVGSLETTHGYFKLDVEGHTKLDLTYYEKSRVRWLHFTAINPQNPQRRAWLHAIRGPAFGQPQLHGKIFTVIFLYFNLITLYLKTIWENSLLNLYWFNFLVNNFLRLPIR